MFRSLRSSLDRVQKTIQTRQNAQKNAQLVVDIYLKELFGAQEQGMTATTVYDASKKQLVIETTSKTLASELILRSGEIAALLRGSGIALQRLFVR